METKGQNSILPIVPGGSEGCFGFSIGDRATCQYPLVKSRMEMNRAFHRCPVRLSARGRGYESNTEIRLSLRKLLQRRRDLSSSTTMGLDHGLADCSMISSFSIRYRVTVALWDPVLPIYQLTGGCMGVHTISYNKIIGNYLKHNYSY